MPPRNFTHSHREQYVAGRRIDIDGTRMVPVSKVTVFAGGTPEGMRAGGYGGGGKAEVIGTYVVDPAGAEKWLPVETVPPGGGGDWAAWLNDQPELMNSIRAALNA